MWKKKLLESCDTNDHIKAVLWWLDCYRDHRHSRSLWKCPWWSGSASTFWGTGLTAWSLCWYCEHATHCVKLTWSMTKRWTINEKQTCIWRNRKLYIMHKWSFTCHEEWHMYLWQFKSLVALWMFRFVDMSLEGGILERGLLMMAEIKFNISTTAYNSLNPASF